MGVQAWLDTMGGMAGKNPFGREGNQGGQPPSPPRRLGGDKGVGSSGADKVGVEANGQGDEDPGERWFR